MSKIHDDRTNNTAAERKGAQDFYDYVAKRAGDQLSQEDTDALIDDLKKFEKVPFKDRTITTVAVVRDMALNVTNRELEHRLQAEEFPVPNSNPTIATLTPDQLETHLAYGRLVHANQQLTEALEYYEATASQGS